MTFDLFCQSIIYMAYVAYRDADPRIPVQDKVGNSDKDLSMC